ncbi:polar amino acid transport system substrate-binding protein [Kribbella sp. VKM Ac-2527]|uniref:Polar amino acid transport system substrate-binding protein n=1 Tax=Kribbella caucasensis TaxID=2512215 RepID=A0A4V3C9P2_9ACTN|nr:ABC transporter substrate-binding protein [Kribbella sp. VKM Ac-2527]TDO46387.1 polar amino acid transport system substrate-binding protein [Kribbella sp. VKM Ac-2527]
MSKLSYALVATTLAAGSLTACGIGSAQTSAVAEDCRPAHQFKTVEEGVLTVASFDVLPYTKVEGKNLTGTDGDIVNAIAKLECLKLNTISSTAAASIPMVQSGRADLTAADWYRTKARAKVVALSDPIYADQMALISKDGISKVEELKGKKVGTVDGYLWVDALREYLGAGLKTYANTPNVYGDLKAGRIDVVVDSFAAGAYNAKDSQTKVAEASADVPVTQSPGQSNFPMAKENTDLIKAVNEDIATLRKSGELAKILEKNGMDPSAADPGEPRLL